MRRVRAAPSAADSARLAKLEQQVADAKGSGDNAWMLTSSALVLMMTGPGLALFYGGLVRRKNVLGTMMQSFILMAVVTVLWAVVGYSLAFGGQRRSSADLRLSLSARRRQRAERRLRRHHPAADLHGLPVDVRHHHPGSDLRRVCRAHEVQRDAAVHGAVVPVVYFPMAHMVWGKGGLLNACLGGTIPDASISPAARWCTSPPAFPRWSARCTWASASAIPNEPMKPHSLVLSFIGACLLWVGWFGFNAGSALAAGSLATSAFVATHFARRRRGAGLGGGGMDAQRQAERAGRQSPAAVAGLVAITPASGFVKPMPALLIGLSPASSAT